MMLFKNRLTDKQLADEVFFASEYISALMSDISETEYKRTFKYFTDRAQGAKIVLDMIEQ